MSVEMYEQPSKYFHEASLLIRHEVDVACKKHPLWPGDYVYGAAILAKESGETIRAALQYSLEHSGEAGENILTEAVQTGAMAIRLVAHLLQNPPRGVTYPSVKGAHLDVPLKKDFDWADVGQIKTEPGAISPIPSVNAEVAKIIAEREKPPPSSDVRNAFLDKIKNHLGAEYLHHVRQIETCDNATLGLLVGILQSHEELLKRYGLKQAEKGVGW